MILQLNVLGLLLLASIAMGNLGELNSIFSTYTHPRESSTCNSIGEPFQRHTVINNIEKAMEIGLNKSFHEKYICLQKVFDEKLIEMQQAYKQNLNTEEPSSSSSNIDSAPLKPSKHQSKLHKYHGQLADHFIGQTGFIYYSIDQNGTITDFKHESFKFVKPVANLTDSSLLESELDAFNSDLFALKALSNNIKKNIRLRMNLLKAIELNEKELELEQKEQDKLLNKSQESAGSETAVSSKKEQKKLKKLHKQKALVDVDEKKTKEKRNVEAESSQEKSVEVPSESVSQESSVQDKKVEANTKQVSEKTKTEQKATTKNKNKKDKKNKSKNGKNKDKSAKRVKSSGKPESKTSQQKPAQNEMLKM